MVIERNERCAKKNKTTSQAKLDVFHAYFMQTNNVAMGSSDRLYFSYERGIEAVGAIFWWGLYPAMNVDILRKNGKIAKFGKDFIE